MKFDFDKYKKRRFHDNDDIDKKIKVLFLYYDYQVIDKKLGLTQQLRLLDIWVIKLIQYELYEVIPMFKLRRSVLIKQINRLNQRGTPILGSFLSKLKNIWVRFKKIVKKPIKIK